MGPGEQAVASDTPHDSLTIAHPTAAATGRQVHHLLIGRIVAEIGKIKLMLQTFIEAIDLQVRERAASAGTQAPSSG